MNAGRCPHCGHALKLRTKTTVRVDVVADARNVMREVAATLAASSTPLSATALARLVHRRHADVRDALAELETIGTAQRNRGGWTS